MLAAIATLPRDARAATALLFITTTTEVYANDRIQYYDVMATATQLTVLCMHAAPLILLRLILPPGIHVYAIGCVWIGWSLRCRKLRGRTWSGAILVIEFAVLLALPMSQRLLNALHLLQGLIVVGFWVAMCFASQAPSFSFLPLDRHLYRGWRHMVSDAEAAGHLLHNVVGHGVLQAAFAVALAPHIESQETWPSRQCLLDCNLLLAVYAITALLAAAIIPPHVIPYTGLDEASGVCMPCVPRLCHDWRLALRGACVRELRFYRAFHTTAANWWLHFLAVPIAWASWLVLLTVAGGSWRLAWVLQAGVALVTLAGLHAPASAAAQLLLAALAESIVDGLGGFRALVAAAISWTVSWVLQVDAGHWRLEKNQPGMATVLTPLSIIISVPMAWQPRGDADAGTGRQTQPGAEGDGLLKTDHERRRQRASPRRRRAGSAGVPIVAENGERAASPAARRRASRSTASLASLSKN